MQPEPKPGLNSCRVGTCSETKDCIHCKMANVRDSDTSLWLHNKLGISNDSWTGGSICSQLNAEVLRNIKDCFPDLQTQVKLKLLLSFFHIPRRNLEEVCLHNKTCCCNKFPLIIPRFEIKLHPTELTRTYLV
jgi:hypothetical protein